jgi:hypothetical protein
MTTPTHRPLWSTILRCLSLFPIVFAYTTAVEAQQVVSHTEPDTNTIIWRIDQPNVRQLDTEFPEIRFQPLDKVYIRAGGCVQTGGMGKTWKRYVNPDFYGGGDADRLYRGLITIPTVPPGPSSPIAALYEMELQVVRPAPGDDTSDWFLHLGYKDQDGDYGDNGYDDHDNGTDDQCKDVGNAWVVIRITHGTKLEVRRPGAPMDLWWDAVDNNVLGLNPRWGAQVLSPGTRPDARLLCNNFHNEGDVLNLGSPSCTTQHPIVDEPSLLQPANYGACQLGDLFNGSVHGHINWGFGTYRGTLYFEDWQVPGVDFNFGDNDYDFALVRSDEAGVTQGNDFRYRSVGNRGIGMEVDSSETINQFTSPWWVSFRNAVQSHPPHTGDWTAAQALVDGREAIAIGLIGIDNQHGGKTEVHPLIGLAIHTSTNRCEDTWAIFARNWGNEGFCSQEQHLFPSNKLAFYFPNPDDRSLLSVNNATTIIGNSSQLSWGTKNVVPTESDPGGVVFTVKLAEPAFRTIAHGEVHLTRTPCMPTTPPPADYSITAKPKPDIRIGEEETDSLEYFIEQLSPARQKILASTYRALPRALIAPHSTDIGRDDSIVDIRAQTLDPTSNDNRQVTASEPRFDEILNLERQDQKKAFEIALGGKPKFEAFLNTVLERSRNFRATEESSEETEAARDAKLFRVDLTNITAKPNSKPRGESWAFDIFVNDKLAFTVPGRRFHLDNPIYTPESDHDTTNVRSTSDDLSIAVVGYNSTRLQGVMMTDWDLNSAEPKSLTLNVPLSLGEIFRLTFSATNTSDDKVNLRLISIEYNGKQKKTGPWTFSVLGNGKSVFTLPATEYKSGQATQPPIEIAGLIDASMDTELTLSALAYQGDIAEGRPVILEGERSFVTAAIASPQGAQFTIRLKGERQE